MRTTKDGVNEGYVNWLNHLYGYGEMMAMLYAYGTFGTNKEAKQDGEPGMRNR